MRNRRNVKIYTSIFYKYLASETKDFHSVSDRSFMAEEIKEPQKKKRSLTELTLGWIADRLRKSEEIKSSIESGKYSVDSQKLAERMVNTPDDDSRRTS